MKTFLIPDDPVIPEDDMCSVSRKAISDPSGVIEAPGWRHYVFRKGMEISYLRCGRWVRNKLAEISLSFERNILYWMNLTNDQYWHIFQLKIQTIPPDGTALKIPNSEPADIFKNNDMISELKLWQSIYFEIEIEIKWDESIN